MTIKQLAKLFEKYSEDEYLEFERVENPPTNRPDLVAFLLLDRLCPFKPGGGNKDIIGSAEHDNYWLSIDAKAFAKVATEADVLTLVRCGIRWDRDIEAFCSFA